MTSCRAACIRPSALVALSLALLSLPPQASAQSAGDPATRLRTMLRETHPAVRQRRAELDVAVARLGAAGLRPPATLSGDAEEVPGGNLAAAGSFRLDLTRELAPRRTRAAERAMAEVDVEGARADLELVERTIDLSVGQLLASVTVHDAIAARLASEDSVLRGAEEALRARFAVADARYVDVLRLRTERLRVETEFQQARFESRVRLRQLVRLAPAADSAVVLALASEVVRRHRTEIPGATGVTLPPLDSVVAASGALRLARLGVAGAEAQRRLVASQQRPALTPSLGIQRFGDASGPKRLGVTAGVSLALPFTASAANRARLSVADRQVTSARVRMETSETLLVTALLQASDRLELARLQLATFDDALLQGLRDEREAALAAYRNGTLSLIELLDFERALAQADVSRLRARLEAHDALYAYLALALGADAPGEIR